MTTYLLLRDKIQSGPYSLDELKLAEIRSTDKLWIQGKSNYWQYPDEIKEIQAFVYTSSENGNSGDMSNTTLHIQIKESPDAKTRTDGNVSPSPYALPDYKIHSADKRPASTNSAEPQKLEANGEGAEVRKIIRVVIADDHTLFREGVGIALSQKKDIQIVGEAENGLQLLHLLKHNMPDVILLDITMPVMDGITALSSIRKRYSDLKVIMLSMHTDHSMVSTLMETGANGYLTKTADSESIYEAIKTCYSKSYFFNELTNMSMLERIRSIKKMPDKHVAPEPEPFRQIVKLPEAQIKPRRRKTRRIRNRLVIAAGIILLIAAGVFAGAFVLRNTAPMDLVLTQSPKQDDIPSPPSNLPSGAQSADLTGDTAKKKAPDSTAKSAPVPALNHADSSLGTKSSQKINLRDSLSGKIIAPEVNNSNTTSVRQRPDKKLQAAIVTQAINTIEKTDSNHVSAIADSASIQEFKSNKRKMLFRKNIHHLVTAFLNDYKIGVDGGLSNIELVIYNQTIYKIDDVTIEVRYLLSDSKAYKTQILSSKGIKPLSSRVLKVPDSPEGIKLGYNIVSIRSKALGL